MSLACVNQHHIRLIQIRTVSDGNRPQIADFPICSQDCHSSFTLPIHTLRFSLPITHCISPTRFIWSLLPTTPLLCYYQSSVFCLNPVAFSRVAWDTWFEGRAHWNTSAVTLWHLAGEMSAAVEGSLPRVWAGCGPSHQTSSSHIWLVIKTLNRGKRK